MIPVAILCGGYGTRSQQPINKCFVDVAGKPFILHTMEMLEKQGVTNFLLCRGSSGTLQALRTARNQLYPRFLVIYGDTYLKIDIRDFIDEWEGTELPSICAERDGIDAGINGFTVECLSATDSVHLTALKYELHRTNLVHHYEAPDPWHEVGTPEALDEARIWFAKQDGEL